jgi:D-alanyl-D-alanine carboxypeptidase
MSPRFVERSVPMPAPAPRVASRTLPVAAPGSKEPIARTPVRTVSIDKNSEIMPEGDDNNEVLPVNTMTAATVREPMKIVPTGVAPEGKFVTFAPPPTVTAFASASAQESPEVTLKAAVTAALAANTPASANASAPASAHAQDNEATASVTRGKWIVQIGAFPSEEKARSRLEDARGHAGGLLARGNPYTETTGKGSAKLYRARFAGFDEATARQACERLKKNDFACFTTRN